MKYQNFVVFVGVACLWACGGGGALKETTTTEKQPVVEDKLLTQLTTSPLTKQLKMIEELGQDKEAKHALNALYTLRDDHNPLVQYRATEAIGKIQTGGDVKKLILSPGDYVVAGASAEAAGKIALTSNETLEAFSKLGITPEGAFRFDSDKEYIAFANAVEYLGDKTPGGVIDRLIGQIAEKADKNEPEILHATMYALINIGQPAVKSLEAAKSAATLSTQAKEIFGRVLTEITVSPSQGEGSDKTILLYTKLTDGGVAKRYEAISQMDGLTEAEADSFASYSLERFNSFSTINIRFAFFRSLLILAKKYPYTIQPFLTNKLEDAVAYPWLVRLLAELRDLDSLIKTLKRKDEAFTKNLIFGTATALGYVGEDAVDSLVEMLNFEDKQFQQRAAFALKVMGPRAVKALPSLIGALNPAKDAEVKISAIDSLFSLHPIATPEQKAQIISTLESLKANDKLEEVQSKTKSLLEALTSSTK